MSIAYQIRNTDLTVQVVRDIKKDFAEGLTKTELEIKYQIPRKTIHRLLEALSEDRELEFLDGTRVCSCELDNVSDEELVSENKRLAKSRQKQMDTNRVERKAFREVARVENAQEEYAKALTGLLEENKWHDPEFEVQDKGGDSVGIVHLSDLHFNEEIKVQGNVYNFRVASARLKYFIEQRALPWFKQRGVKTVLVAMTGDMLNSDRRLEELMCNSYNRAKATYLAVDILQQVIRTLAAHFENVKVAYTVGNESRATDKVAWSSNTASDSYDCSIFYWLRSLFSQSKNVSFIIGDESELVIEIAGKNILLTHGHGFSKDLEGSVAKCRARYAARGVMLSKVLCGHVHSACISDTYARSSSLSGPNAFSETGLNLTGRASQNLYICSADGSFDGQVVDLHKVDVEDRYAFEEHLESYNTQANEKLHRETTIVKIVI